MPSFFHRSSGASAATGAEHAGAADVTLVVVQPRWNQLTTGGAPARLQASPPSLAQTIRRLQLRFRPQPELQNPLPATHREHTHVFPCLFFFPLFCFWFQPRSGH
jgi:membrane-bound metal-dependent hydrolase YbcI (DUF457 family)